MLVVYVFFMDMIMFCIEYIYQNMAMVVYKEEYKWNQLWFMHSSAHYFQYNDMCHVSVVDKS